MSHLMNTYARQAVGFVRGEGAWLWDAAGKRYLDGMSGIAVNGLGHAHPKVVRAICEQAAQVIHTSNLYQIPRQEELADLLCRLSGMEEVFFCSSGAEANEAAIKLARLYAHNQDIENPAIVVMDKAWHGRTLATLSATGSRKAQAGFEPLMGGFVRVPYNDISAVRQVAGNNRSIVAVLMEVLQGEGGIIIADVDYLRSLRQICDERGWLLMIDEVQSGIGRTGKWFAHQWAGILPDVMTLAKGLGNGVPIGACLGALKANGVFKPGSHGATFGGGPLACAAALATLRAMDEEGLLDNAIRVGDQIRSELRAQFGTDARVKDIRGKGLMIGIELDRPCGEIVQRCLDQGVLVNITADTVIRLLPPLVMTSAQAQQLVASLVSVVKSFLAA